MVAPVLGHVEGATWSPTSLALSGIPKSLSTQQQQKWSLLVFETALEPPGRLLCRMKELSRSTLQRQSKARTL